MIDSLFFYQKIPIIIIHFKKPNEIYMKITFLGGCFSTLYSQIIIVFIKNGPSLNEGINVL